MTKLRKAWSNYGEDALLVSAMMGVALAVYLFLAYALMSIL